MKVSMAPAPRRGRVGPQRASAVERSGQVKLIELGTVKRIATNEEIKKTKARRKPAAQRSKRKSLRARKLTAWKKRKARRKRWAGGQRRRIHRRLARVVARRPAGGKHRQKTLANPAVVPNQAAETSPRNLAKPAGEPGVPATGNTVAAKAPLTEHPGKLKHPFTVEPQRGLIPPPEPWRTGEDPAAAAVAVDTAIGLAMPPEPVPAEPVVAAAPAGAAVPEEMFAAAEFVYAAAPPEPSHPEPAIEVSYTPAPVAVIEAAEPIAPAAFTVNPVENAVVQEPVEAPVQVPAQAAPAAPELNIVPGETIIPDPAFIHILQSGTEPVELGNEWRQVEADEAIGSVLPPEMVQALAAEVSPPSIPEPADGESGASIPGSGAVNEES
ncbi:hypothetical protein [Paenibacillus macerans]|uniref:hypothetical protein n=1 Tax=Paenibacillus macerans TaxID=44252 RepID=UPI002041A57F|nr:hypothetical protein [Paenibacillus macerans]MCM3700446.1 hypothetical protein [Paenibacillus macerans]